MESNYEKVVKIANNMNTLINFNKLAIPLLEDFILVKKNLQDPNSNAIFVAIKNNTIEQFLGDGILKPTESFEERITKVLKEMKEESKNNALYSEEDEAIIYYKNYDNDDFDFRLFVQDIPTGTKETPRFIRQLNAFFVEPKDNEFYQIAMSAGQYPVSDEFKLLKDIKELEKDPIIQGLEYNLKIIMDNISYRD